MSKRKSYVIILILVSFIVLSGCGAAKVRSSKNYIMETKAEKDARMQWWRQARFGMFIHWGLYAVPAGVYGDRDNHAEWILTKAQIPVHEYEKYAQQFNPIKFNADQWVSMAKDAGMKYIVITSKHHDGFCLWNSKVGDYDIMDRTPYKKDILKALSKACKKHGIKLCFYHSIMDWHHTDYLPRRKWEKRSAEGADMQRYIKYMKAQLKELVTEYDPELLWFDGEWENTWTHEEGVKLYNYVRSLKPDIIINNRVDKGRKGMQGLTKEGDFAGDFGTPEQEVPAGGLSGIDWESCITMNGHWGYCAADKNFKSTKYLIHQLIEITSKGGNYLLNIGPTSEGLFPPESVERLAEMGKWMRVNGESIYATKAGPFKSLSWGKCTQKDGKLYMHVFDWPEDGKLVVPGLKNHVKKAYLLGVKASTLKVTRDKENVVVYVPGKMDSVATVVVLEIDGPPKVVNR
ncbi:MAG TPA: alpha-L-fucosidase [Phycisphaerales bacterium]|nr:alpha-L-fucosidase [Phycisphaerales bacterium]